LIAWAMRRAVVRSGLRSATRTDCSAESWKLISRSTMAPLAMRPAVGTPRVIDWPWPCAEKPETATVPWAIA
jgi:hypothetical protein